MKLKFDSNLQYQQEAIASVTDLFAELAGQGAGLTHEFNKNDANLWSELGIGNIAIPSDAKLLEKLHSVQVRNQIPKSRALREEAGAYEFPNFSVEMETGTGKTYVYLRTIFELNKQYGFKKFIIVVPSVAITASNPDDKGELFDPAADKIYRHPTFYEIPDEVGHM